MLVSYNFYLYFSYFIFFSWWYFFNSSTIDSSSKSIFVCFWRWISFIRVWGKYITLLLFLCFFLSFFYRWWKKTRIYIIIVLQFNVPLLTIKISLSMLAQCLYKEHNKHSQPDYTVDETYTHHNKRKMRWKAIWFRSFSSICRSIRTYYETMHIGKV